MEKHELLFMLHDVTNIICHFHVCVRGMMLEDRFIKVCWAWAIWAERHKKKY